MRIGVFQRTHHRLAGLAGTPRKLHEPRRELLPKRHKVADDALSVRVILHKTPRRHRELHHRAERVHLRAADEKLLVVRSLGAGQIGRPGAASDHVGADERIAEKPGREHIGNKAANLRPRVPLVGQTNHDVTSRHSPDATMFACRIVLAVYRVRMVLRCASRTRRVDDSVCGRIVLEMSAVQLEAVHAVVSAQPVELCAKPPVADGIGEVEKRGVAVPPADVNRGLRLCVKDETALPRRIGAPVFSEVAVRLRVERDERNDPEKNLEPHLVQLVAHALRVAEPARVELPHAVRILPRVVDHEDARRQAVVEHRLRIVKDALLVLVVRKLHPRVVLRRREEKRIRRLA